MDICFPRQQHICKCIIRIHMYIVLDIFFLPSTETLEEAGASENQR